MGNLSGSLVRLRGLVDEGRLWEADVLSQSIGGVAVQYVIDHVRAHLSDSVFEALQRAQQPGASVEDWSDLVEVLLREGKRGQGIVCHRLTGLTGCLQYLRPLALYVLAFDPGPAGPTWRRLGRMGEWLSFTDVAEEAGVPVVPRATRDDVWAKRRAIWRPGCGLWVGERMAVVDGFLLRVGGGDAEDTQA